MYYNAHANLNIRINMARQPGSDLDALLANMGDDADAEEKLVIMGRLTADLRSKLSKLTVQYYDLKSSTAAEIKKLQEKLAAERKKRADGQQVKLEKREVLMKALEEKDIKIVLLQKELSKFKNEEGNELKQFQIYGMNSQHLGSAKGRHRMTKADRRGTGERSRQMAS